GDSNQELYYLLAWDSLADREKKWAAFGADPEWQAKRAETEEDGPIVANAANQLLSPTAFCAGKQAPRLEPALPGAPGPRPGVGGDIGRELRRRGKLRIGAELGELPRNVGRPDGGLDGVVQARHQDRRCGCRQENAVGARGLVAGKSRFRHRWYIRRGG